MRVFTLPTAWSTPLPAYRSGSPSRSSSASNSPVEAPLGTAARPAAPLSSTTSASTVGLPRESRISRARTSRIADMKEPRPGYGSAACGAAADRGAHAQPSGCALANRTRDRRFEHPLDAPAHVGDQHVPGRLRVVTHPDRLAEADDNPARADAPGALGKDVAGAEDGDGHDVHARVQREHERALLERLEPAVARPRSLREDHDGAVVLAEQPPGLVERADRRGAVAAVHGDVARRLPGWAEERDPGELLLCDEPVALGDRDGEREHVVP